MEQDSFANQVVEVETWLPAQDLLETFSARESERTGEREVHWGPRLIFGLALIVEPETLYRRPIIASHPHSGTPFCPLEFTEEIAPHFIHPILKQPIRNLYDVEKIEKNSISVTCN